MNLVVLGSENISSLLKVVNHVFSAIPNIIRRPKTYDKDNVQPFTNHMSRIVIYQSVSFTDRLTLYWQTPSLDNHPSNAVSSFILRYLKHRGEGSVFSYLKKQHLASRLGANVTTADSFYLFKIRIMLTESGFKNVTAVIKIVFEFLEAFRRKSFKEMKVYWNNFINVSLVKFDHGLRKFSSYLM